MRDHQAIVIEEFNGLFRRDGQDSVPADHFTDCNNIQYTQSGFKTRDGIEPYLPYGEVVRIYPFNQSVLVLDVNGNIYHSDRALPFSPILHINGMLDFHITKYANRVYITPNGPTSEFVYVYTYGDAAGARKAAGVAPTSAPSLSIGGAGHVEKGVHVIAVAYETDTGFVTSLSPGANITVDGSTSITVSLPIGSAFVAKRHIVATYAVDPADFTGNVDGYQFFFIATVDNNTDTSVDIDFYDAELLEDASYLKDLYEEIPNCGGLTLYHDRLVGWSRPQGTGGEFISDVIVSNQGEPESISQVDGLFQLTRDGLPITACFVYRDILYVTKANKTAAVNDNQDVPSAWPIGYIDSGIGATNANLIAVVMDVGETNIEAVLIGHTSGILLFNGTYVRPEITWKIRDVYVSAREIHINTNKHLLYVLLDDGTMLMGDFKNSLDAMKIRWTPWTFDIKVSSLAILLSGGNETLLLGSQELRS